MKDGSQELAGTPPVSLRLSSGTGAPPEYTAVWRHEEQVAVPALPSALSFEVSWPTWCYKGQKHMLNVFGCMRRAVKTARLHSAAASAAHLGYVPCVREVGGLSFWVGTRLAWMCPHHQSRVSRQ